jgi:type I restriction enzyme, R subunit
VDYIGIFDDVAQALDFDEKAVQQVVSNIDDLRKELPIQVQKCLAFFPGVDRSVGGYEGLMAAQQALPNNEVRDGFAAEYSLLSRIWEALSPDPLLRPYENDYRWLTQVSESVKPPSGNGKLLWHALSAKTVALINENVHVDSVRDDVETLVMDAQVLQDILESADPAKKEKEIEIKLIARLRRHLGNPKFTALGERLEKIKERHEQGFLTSLEFLKEVLELAKEVVEAEKGVDPVEERDRAKEAVDGVVQRGEEREHPHHRRAHSRRYRRHREEGAVPGMAAHESGGTIGPEGASPDTPEIQAAYGPGALR